MKKKYGDWDSTAEVNLCAPEMQFSFRFSFMGTPFRVVPAIPRIVDIGKILSAISRKFCDFVWRMERNSSWLRPQSETEKQELQKQTIRVIEIHVRSKSDKKWDRFTLLPYMLLLMCLTDTVYTNINHSLRMHSDAMNTMRPDFIVALLLLVFTFSFVFSRFVQTVEPAKFEWKSVCISADPSFHYSVVRPAPQNCALLCIRILFFPASFDPYPNTHFIS